MKIGIDCREETPESIALLRWRITEMWNDSQGDRKDWKLTGKQFGLATIPTDP
jgi:hypothetical protein